MIITPFLFSGFILFSSSFGLLLPILCRTRIVSNESVQPLSRSSSVSIVNRLRAGRPGFDSRQKQKFHLFSTSSRPTLGPTQPPTQWVPRSHSLGVKRLRRETDGWHPASAEVRYAWRYTSIPQYMFVVWCLVKHRDNFTCKRNINCTLLLRVFVI